MIAGPDRQINEEFNAANTYAHSFIGNGPATCEAARRALLSQGYLVSEASGSVVQGHKNFQPNSSRHVRINFHVVCAAEAKGSNITTAFANAIRDTYSLKTTSNSASVGIGALGSVSIPFGSTNDSLVKVASETIGSEKFYSQFFGVVERYMDGPLDELEEEGNAEKQE